MRINLDQQHTRTWMALLAQPVFLFLVSMALGEDDLAALVAVLWVDFWYVFAMLRL